MQHAITVFFTIFTTLCSLPGYCAEGDEAWWQYRQLHPYLHQDIAVSHNADMDETYVIFTEPPASVLQNADAIALRVFGQTLLSVAVQKHPIGFDGWAKDLLFTLASPSEPVLVSQISALAREAYGTDYKASFAVFEPKPWRGDLRYVPSSSVSNLQVSQTSLHKWLFGETARFVAAGVNSGSHGEPMPIDAHLEPGRVGLLYSQEPGLVLLVLDTTVDLNAAKTDLRAFTLDSDVILGAAHLKQSNRLVLVGRERQASLSEARPLRLDMILALAAVESADLGQSYERNLPFAGKVSSHDLEATLEPPGIKNQFASLIFGEIGVDWAPILLSRELTHTEFGHLLNIADQLLKSWSLSGSIDYGNFIYTQPLQFPTVTGVMRLLSDQLGREVTSLTFNWNTAGFGSWVTFAEVDIFAVNRTGSLPVSYLPDFGSDGGRETENDALRSAEDRYWAFFAGLSNPHLVRVAQYTALHQIFLDAEIKAQRVSPIPGKPNYKQRWSGLADEFAAAMNRLTQRSETQATEFPPTACEEDPQSTFEFLAEDHDQLIELWTGSGNVVSAVMDRTTFVADRLAELQRSEAKYNMQVDEVNDEIDSYNTDAERCQISGGHSQERSCAAAKFVMREARIDMLSKSIDGLEAQLNDWQSKLENVLERADALTSVGGFNYLVTAAGNCTIAIEAVIAGNADIQGAVYKTPSIVVSRSDDGWRSVGGHNVDGRTLKLVPDRSISPGKFSLDAETGTLKLSPRDIGLAPQAARVFERQRLTYKFGTSADKRRIERELESVLRQPWREAVPMTASALARSPEPVGYGRGLRRHLNKNRVFATEPTRALKKAEARSYEDYLAEYNAQIVAERVDGRYLIYVAGTRPPVVHQSGTLIAYRAQLQRLMTEVAQTQNGRDSVAVVTRNGLSEADALNFTRSFEAQQIVAEAASGGGGIKPPNSGSRFGYFFSGGRGSGSGGEGRRFGREPLRIFGDFFRSQKTLRRKDLDWRRAVVTELRPAGIKRDGLLNSKTATIRIEMPTEKQTTVVAELNATFTGRTATESDLAKMSEVARRNLDQAALEKGAATDPDPILGEILLRIRNDYREELRGNPYLWKRLLDPEYLTDVHIVRLRILSQDRHFVR
ncbi:hypothetical protein [Parasedimentitalea psychrophila]|uniref:Uncharacterized protein n=1 Tax=Parasedimentitalea psychrophila TaxID=2997337 RepID=A0A9Y2P1X7_9RHOB|nr:hypothetical protein [Parasedimentitalea psychrophila]WIY24527.1 hypothetical protein QPJ95_18590 [Parasedimentitalea psychrophila]